MPFTPPPDSKMPPATGLSADDLAHVLDDALATPPATPEPPERPAIDDVMEIIRRRMRALVAETDSAPAGSEAPAEGDEADILVLDASCEVPPPDRATAAPRCSMRWPASPHSTRWRTTSRKS